MYDKLEEIKKRKKDKLQKSTIYFYVRQNKLNYKRRKKDKLQIAHRPKEITILKQKIYTEHSFVKNEMNDCNYSIQNPMWAQAHSLYLIIKGPRKTPN